MSTSLLYHGWGLVGYSYQSTDYDDGAVIFDFTLQDKRLRCPVCGTEQVTRRGCKVRTFRACPIGSTPVWLRLPIPRVACADCGIVRQVKLGFAEPDREHTRQFARYVLDLLRLGAIEHVARHLGVSWGLVKDIQKRWLKARYARPRLDGLRHIAIDEIYIGKKGGYLTLVLDLETGAIVYVGKGKGGDALNRFWAKLIRSGAKILAVAIDMSKAYVAAVREHLPNALQVFDRFHVVKLFNEKLSDLRRDLHREATGALDKKALKGTRWLLLKNAENLSDQRTGRRRSEKERLEEALKLNQPLATAYYLKEDLRQFWNQANRKSAKTFLDDWLKRAEAAGIQMLTSMAKTLRAYREGLLNYYHTFISSGPLEGTNNKIRTLQRQAYGYRDEEFFHLKLFALHVSKYALVG
jgi:transposase